MQKKDDKTGKFIKTKGKIARVCVNCGHVDIVFPYYAGRKFCSTKCMGEFRVKNKLLIGENHPNWNGGRSVQRGYVVLSGYRGHPMATSRGHIREHRLVMAAHIGRYLSKNEDVHHINGNKLDSRIENLELLSHSDHISKDNAQKGKKYWGVNAHLHNRNTPRS